MRQTLEIAELVEAAGGHGIVCSASELTFIRQYLGRPVFAVTPGIRPRGAPTQDQARVTTVEEAVRAGSSLLVLGRAVTSAADPRAALALRVGDHQTLRIAAGRYHQPADPTQLDPIYGNPRLGPLTADHVIAGYEWKSEFGNVRVEAFHKQYTDLVTQDSVTFYANQGHGHARGVDVFVQGTYRWLSGWASYGFLDARRKELDDPEEVPAAYGVRHSLTLVSQYLATSTWSVGARYTYEETRTFARLLATLGVEAEPLAVDRLATILWNKDHLILAIPSGMRQAPHSSRHRQFSFR